MRLAQIGAEIRLHLIGIVLQPGIDLPAIASRCTPAWLMRLQHRDIHTLLRQMQRGR